jgi:hypothetical protein
VNKKGEKKYSYVCHRNGKTTNHMTKCIKAKSARKRRKGHCQINGLLISSKLSLLSLSLKCPLILSIILVTGILSDSMFNISDFKLSGMGKYLLCSKDKE